MLSTEMLQAHLRALLRKLLAVDTYFALIEIRLHFAE